MVTNSSNSTVTSSSSWLLSILIATIVTSVTGVNAAADFTLSSLGQINIMVVTDVHSWVAGHNPHEPQYNADYGDILSFYEHLQSKCKQQQRDCFFVMNGDFVDGTGLSTSPPSHLTKILMNMPWDAINIGNHELYKNETIEFIKQEGGFVDFWRGKYLTSNVLWHSNDNVNITASPIGQRYHYLHAPFSNKTILTFGFLFNMRQNCKLTVVETVQDVIDSNWFTNVVSGGCSISNNNSNITTNSSDSSEPGQQQSSPKTFDAILILAHMGYDDPLVDKILHRIRTICGNEMPVQFVTGHTHIRAYRQLDYYSSSFEAGRYLDTVGLVSFPFQSNTASSISSNNVTAIKKQQADQQQQQQNMDFSHTFLTTNTTTMKQFLGVDTLKTTNGTKLSKLINDTQKKLGLLSVLGCSPMTYYLYTRKFDDEDSLLGLYYKKVIPTQLFSLYESTTTSDDDADNTTSDSSDSNQNNMIFIQGIGAFRYDLFKGNVTLTDFISVSPYNDTIHVLQKKVKGLDIVKAFGGKQNNHLSKDGSKNPFALGFAFTGGGVNNDDDNDVNNSFNTSLSYKVFVADFDLNLVKNQLMNVTQNKGLLSSTELKNVTTGVLWRQYINTTWPTSSCAQTKTTGGTNGNQPRDFFDALKDFFEDLTALKVIAFILTFVIIMFFGWMFICRSHNTSMFSYDYSSEESGLSDMDDLSIDEFSSNGSSSNGSSVVYLSKGSSSSLQYSSALPQASSSSRGGKRSNNTYHSLQHADSQIL